METNKTSNFEKKNRYLTNDQEIANVMNHYNINITDSLNLNLEHQIYDIDEIEQYKDYPSIVKIKIHYNQTSGHVFRHVTQEDIIKEINELSANESVPTTDVPIPITKSCKGENSNLKYLIMTSSNRCTFINVIF